MKNLYYVMLIFMLVACSTEKRMDSSGLNDASNEPAQDIFSDAFCSGNPITPAEAVALLGTSSEKHLFLNPEYSGGLARNAVELHKRVRNSILGEFGPWAEASESRTIIPKLIAVNDRLILDFIIYIGPNSSAERTTCDVLASDPSSCKPLEGDNTTNWIDFRDLVFKGNVTKSCLQFRAMANQGRTEYVFGGNFTNPELGVPQEDM